MNVNRYFPGWDFWEEDDRVGIINHPTLLFMPKQDVLQRGWYWFLCNLGAALMKIKWNGKLKGQGGTVYLIDKCVAEEKRIKALWAQEPV